MNRLLPWALAALLLGLALSVLCVPYLPTHDGPQHVFTVHVANHLDEPGTGWSRFFEPNSSVSAYGFSTFYTPLDLWLPWEPALRITLALLVVLWGAGAFALARALHPERAWLGLALAAAALQWTFYMGFFSFYVASAFGLGVLAFALRRRPGRRRDLELAGLLFVQTLLHLVAAAFTGLAIAVLELARSRPGTRAASLWRLVVVGTPAAAVAATAFSVQLAFGEAGIDEEWSYQPTPFWVLAKCFAGGPAWRAWPLTLLALASPLLLLAARGRGPRSAEDRALLMTGGLFLAAALIAPLHLPNWDFFSVRFVPLGVCLLVAALPVERLRPPGRRIAALAAAVFATAATGWGAAYHRDLAARTQPALAGLDTDLRSDGARLPIILDPYAGPLVDDAERVMPFTAPLLNLGKLYALAQGGLVPYTFFSDPAIHAVLLSPWGRQNLPSAPDPRAGFLIADPERAGDLARREATTAFYAAYGMQFEEVIFWGRPEDAEHLLWLGYEPRWREGGLAIARFRGCPRTLRFPADAPLGDAAVLELGWYPALEATHRYTLGNALRAPDGARVLPMRQSCGALWVRFEDPFLECEGADAQGRWVLPPARHSESICQVVRRARPRAPAATGDV